MAWNNWNIHYRFIGSSTKVEMPKFNNELCSQFIPLGYMNVIITLGYSIWLTLVCWWCVRITNFEKNGQLSF